MKKQHEIIRDRLRERNLSAAWLARETGRTKQYMARVVKGDYAITSKDLIDKVATALDLDPDDLYVSAGRLPPDITEAIITYPAFVKVIRANREKLEAKR